MISLIETAPPSRARILSRSNALALSLSLAAACAAPAPEHLESSAVARTVTERASDADSIAQALELANLAVLPLDRPSAQELADANTAGFWRGCAYAWNPGVRAARRALLAQRAATGATGRPGPIKLLADNTGFDGADRETELSLTFDLLGLLRVGASDAERHLARAEEREALAALEQALWTARFDVERARLRVSAAKAREAALTALIDEAKQERERIEILSRRGRLSQAESMMGFAALHELEHELTGVRTELAASEAELSRASGLPPAHPAVLAVAPNVVRERPETRIEWSEPSPQELLERDPQLRALRLAHAVAEARVRSEVADSRPGVRIGPKWTFTALDTLPGGMLEIEVPFPGARQGRVRAAVESRTAAREALEDELVNSMAEVHRARESLVQAIVRRDEHAIVIDNAMDGAWQAVRARFRAQQASIDEWVNALKRRVEPLVGVVDEQERAALALLDLEQARGPRATDETSAASDPNASPAAGGEVRP